MRGVPVELFGRCDLRRGHGAATFGDFTQELVMQKQKELSGAALASHEAKIAGVKLPLCGAVLRSFLAKQAKERLPLTGAALYAHLRAEAGLGAGVVSLRSGDETQVEDGLGIVDDEDEERVASHLTPTEVNDWSEQVWQATLEEEATRRLQEYRTIVTLWGRRMRMSEYLAKFGETNDILVEDAELGASAYMVYEGYSYEGEIVIEEFTPREIELRIAVAERMAGSQQVLTGLERFDTAEAALVECGHKLAPSPGHIEEVRERFTGMTREEVAAEWPLPERIAQ